MYRTILLAYDGSREGRLALREGARLAQICGARVVLLAVVDLSSGFYAMGDASGVFVLSDPKEDVQKILDEGVERLTRMGFTPESRLETGPPTERIVATADAVAADLVVVGHHQQGPFSRWLIGSVASSLIDGLKCSLLVARLEVSDDVLFKGHITDATTQPPAQADSSSA